MQLASAPSEALPGADENTTEKTFSGMSATYSPEDNKLRLSSVRRLDPELYARVKAAGFRWAPKQEVFIAPMWTTAREDLLLELCGEIDDEDSTMFDRAEERADRFENYSIKRGAEAEAAHAHVKQIAGRFEFGQPILVGHHSERGARKDKERIENGMRKAVKMWERSEYWVYRAEAAKRHERYKQLPDVRYRRIKGLESDKRKKEKNVAENKGFMLLWATPGLTLNQAAGIADRDHITVRSQDKPFGDSLYSLLVDGKMTPAEAAERAIRCHERSNVWAARWIAHYACRIQYERAMLGEAGGIAADKFDIVIGGSVLVRGEWVTVMRVTKKEGRIVSVSTNARFVRVRSIEEVDDYRAPTAEVVSAVAKATKLPKMCNYPGEGFVSMTQDEWKRTHADYKGSRQLGQDAQRARPGSGRPDVAAAAQAAEAFGLHRVRVVVRFGSLSPVFLSDAKIVQPPAGESAPAAPVAPIPAPMPATARPAAQVEPQPTQKTEFAAMREALRNGGVQTVVAEQLFPTPGDLAARVVQEAGIEAGEEILEPSAGTGALIGAIVARLGSAPSKITAIEINTKLAGMLSRNWPVRVICQDFLEWDGMTPEGRASFHAIVMNPPFANSIDIAHINHARSFLKPGGRLVAICLNGPRQQAVLQPIAEASGGFYEPLPADSFKHAGTGVNTALLVIHG